jgi:methionyl-tRNA formyltransferase
MRFAMACNDRHRYVFKTFIEAGWEPVKLYTQPLDNRLDFNREVVAHAQRLGIDIQLSSIGEWDLKDLAARECEALIVAEHGALIPDWQSYLSYAINFHAAPLPEGRGPYPMVRAIYEGRDEWAVTCHKISDRFDRGDILGAETFPLASDECHDSMDIKIQLAARRLAVRVVTNFHELWSGAKPQGKGRYWHRYSDEDRTIDFSSSVDTILRLVRAFGPLETIASVNGTNIFIERATGWTEPHSHKAGTLIHLNRGSLVFAVKDGFVSFHEWSAVPKQRKSESLISK